MGSDPQGETTKGGRTVKVDTEKVLMEMEDYFGRELNKTQAERYLAELSPYGMFQIKAAARRICRERKPMPSQFPTPAEFADMIGPYKSDRPTTTTDDIGPLVRAAAQLEKNGSFDTEGLSLNDVAAIQHRHNYRFKMVPRSTPDGLSYYDLYRRPATGGKWKRVHSGLEAVRRMKHPARGDISIDFNMVNGGS
jgi:hypothetical protein